MECGDYNLQRCKENLTSLRLTSLPEKRKLNAVSCDLIFNKKYFVWTSLIAFIYLLGIYLFNKISYIF